MKNDVKDLDKSKNEKKRVHKSNLIIVSIFISPDGEDSGKFIRK